MKVRSRGTRGEGVKDFMTIVYTEIPLSVLPMPRLSELRKYG